MLANLTSLIWGKSETPSCDVIEKSTENDDTKSLDCLQETINSQLCNNTRCTTPEDDWVLVDKQGKF